MQFVIPNNEFLV